MEGNVEPARESRINLFFYVARENDESLTVLQTLQEVADFKIGIAIRAVLNFSTFSEERLCFIKKKYRVALFRLTKSGLEVFLRFPHPFRNDTGQIHSRERKAEKPRNDFSGERLAGSGLTREQSF